MDVPGNPLEFLLTAGTVHDSTVAVELFSRFDLSESNVLGDKAYGMNKILEITSSRQMGVYDSAEKQYGQTLDLHLRLEQLQGAELFFHKLKWFRRVATRYDKRNDIFLATVFLASIIILLK